LKKIEFKNEKQRELMANFGVAVYFAQMIENTINFICCLKRFEETKGDYLEDYETYRKNLKDMTLGNLIKELVKVYPEIYQKVEEGEFKRAKEIRDFLGHKFFRDGLEFSLISDKEDEMIQLLVDHASSLKEFDLKLTKIMDEFSLRLKSKLMNQED
jgi:hypothetical protein